MSNKQNKRIYRCPKCDVLCIKNVKKFPSGKVVHRVCDTEVEDVTKKVDQNNTAPAGSYD